MAEKKFVVESEEDNGIQRTDNPNDLDRRIVTQRGVVLCKCDGTSAAVRNCLATSRNYYSDKNQIKPNRGHSGLVRMCSSAALARLQELINEDK